MRIGIMLSDVANSLFRKPATERYPFEPKEPAERFRGQLLWNQENCTGCGLCAMDCPAGAIEVIVIDKKAKRFVFRYHVDHCTFCGQCVFSCRQDSLKMSNDLWELAALNKEGFTIDSGDEQDILLVLEGEPEAT